MKKKLIFKNNKSFRSNVMRVQKSKSHVPFAVKTSLGILKIKKKILNAYQHQIKLRVHDLV